MSEATPSSSPPPPADATPAPPPALNVGKVFVKRYYQALSTTPDQIYKFYQPTSYLSDAVGSSATDPSTFENYDIATRWGGDNKMRIELENGAIDAQTSVNGSILVVVTGHVVFLSTNEKAAFVHTFFLATMANTRRFYVHNDILRFLNRDISSSSAPTAAETIESEVNPEQSEEAEKVEEMKPETEPSPAPTPEPETPVVEEAPAEEEAPGGGVEESKEVESEEEEETPAAVEEKTPEPVPEPEPPVEEPAAAVEETKEEPPAEAIKPEAATTPASSPVPVPAPAPAAPKENNKGRKQKGRGRSPPKQEQQPKQQPAAPKSIPGSWASLVASGGGAVSTPVAPSPVKVAPVEKPPMAAEAKPPASAPSQPEKTEITNGSSNLNTKKHGDRPKRDPDCTLVIKNLGENTKDSDLRALFERFAVQTKASIVGTTVSSHRGLGFVDYDAVAPVLAAVEFHAKDPIHLNGRKLEVDQKTAEQRARRNRGGYRSGSPGNNNGNYRGGGGGGGGGGGRGQYNRRGGDRGRGGGDRSGGRGGGGGGGRGTR